MTPLKTALEKKWRDIPGYEGHYQVSDSGEIKSFRRNAKGVLLTLTTTILGYHQTCLMVNGHAYRPLVQGLVMSAFVGPRPNGHEVNHKNGIKTDNRIENLEYVTPSENMMHAIRTGLQKIRRGSELSHAKLNEAQVREIFLSPDPVRALSKIYGVCDATIYKLKAGGSWRHITADLRKELGVEG